MDRIGWQRDLEVWTERAGQAASLGQWDQVGEYYRLRGEHLQDGPIAPALAEQLLTLDQFVKERAVVARAALESMLAEVATIRQRLQGLRLWDGVGDSTHHRMDHRA